jgi:HEAT repeat protein
MSEQEATVEPLSPERAARLLEFAKACRAAARIVSMYPPTHPAIQNALARIVAAGKQAIADGPFAISVLPDSMLVGGRGLPKPDAAVSELAQMLHQHAIGAVTITGELSNSNWHTFLSLIAKSPEDTRALGGIVPTWQQTGTAVLTMQIIDYAEVLRERDSGTAATWDRIVELLGGGRSREEILAALIDMADDPQQLAQFVRELQEDGTAAGVDASQQRQALLEIIHGLARHTYANAPEKLDSVLSHLTEAVTKLPPDVLLTLLTQPPPEPPPTEAAAPVDLAKELQSRASNEMVSDFLVSNVARDRGATARLAAAFTTLVPDTGRQQDILSMAAEQAAALFAQDPHFEKVWNSSSEMLMSYSDEQFVSDSYARELTSAQSQAVDITKIGDDPPARIRAWVSTLGEEEVRRLDQQLLLDLLKIESRADAWTAVLDVVVGNIDQLVLVGDLTQAADLLDAVVTASKQADPARSAAAAAAVKLLVDGPLVRNLALFLRQATDSEVGLAKQICMTLGPAMVEPLAQALMAEDNSRTVRRLRDILIGFGPAAREYANKLRGSPSPAVRRAAVDLLRALGGDAALPDLRRMLDDSDEQVQRDALRGIVQIGTNDAYQALEEALQSGAEHTRTAIMQALGALRDQRAAPLFVHILTHSDFKGTFEPVYTSAIESLGRLADDDKSVAALETVLHRGEFWAPGRTARLRLAAAKALHSMGTEAALRTLSAAAASGPRGVKRAARAALAEPSPTRPRRTT